MHPCEEEKLSLKGKYILFATGILLVVTGVFAYHNLRIEERQIIEDERKKAALMAEVIKNGLMTAMLKDRGPELQKYIASMAVEQVEVIRLLKPDGTLIGASPPAEGQGGGKFPVKTEPSAWQEGDRYHLQMPIYNEIPCRRCHRGDGDIMAVLGVEFQTSRTFQKIAVLRQRTLLLYLVTLIVLSISLAFMTTYLVNRPIKAIIGTMNQAEAGDLNVRVITGRRDEIGLLAASLNSMLSQLSKARQDLDSCHFEAMQRVEKMATIGELAAAVAHEIKNPLAGISGAIQVLAEDFPRTDPRRVIIDEVLSEIDRLDKAVRDLLSFARPPEPNFIRVSITPVIERALRLVGAQAKKQGVKINIMTSDDKDAFRVDPELMQQVFLNIMMNALHSMPAGGTLTVSTHLREGEGEVVIADTGQGIPKEEIKNIFKPFFTTKHTGTGLGLGISKGIVEKHGGRITVESRMGSGSTFRIILPLEAASA